MCPLTQATLLNFKHLHPMLFIFLCNTFGISAILLTQFCWTIKKFLILNRCLYTRQHDFQMSSSITKCRFLQISIKGNSTAGHVLIWQDVPQSFYLHLVSYIKLVTIPYTSNCRTNSQALVVKHSKTQELGHYLSMSIKLFEYVYLTIKTFLIVRQQEQSHQLF